MGAHIEWLTPKIGILRVGRKFIEFLDPYEFSCVGERRGDNIIIFKGGSSKGKVAIVAERDSIRDCLEPLGIKWVIWSRVKHRKERYICLPVEKRSKAA